MRYFLKIAGLAVLFSGMVSGAFAQAVWDVRNPLTPTPTFFAITWAGNQFVAVGEKGAIMTSPNGITWTSRPGPSTLSGTTYFGITWNSAQNKIVAVGNGGAIAYSADGQNWSKATLPAGYDASVLYAATSNNLLAANGGKFVVAAKSGVILTSTDGVTWTGATPKTTNLYGAAWNLAKNSFAVVGAGGKIQTSPDAVTWTEYSTGNGADMFAVTSVSGNYVVLGNSGRVQVSTSSDLSTWTNGTVPTPLPNFSGVAYGAELVAIAGTGGNIYTSSSPAGTWTLQSSGVTADLYGIAYNGSNKYVVVGANGLILSSPNGGSSWTKVSSSFATLLAIDSGNGMRVAVGAGGVILTSTDDITWTPRSWTNPKKLTGVTWNGSGFTAVGDGGTIIASTDGITWNPQTSNVTFNFTGVTWTGTANNRIIAVNSDGAAKYNVYTSNGGTSWAVHGSTTQAVPFYAVASNPTVIVGVGAVTSSFNIRSCPVASTTWTNRANSGAIMYAVTWAGTRFVAVGGSGTIMIGSADGQSWTPSTTGSNATLYAVGWTGNQIVAVGSGGTVLTSPDGASGSWQVHTIPFARALYGVTWSGNLVSAVGDTGTIVTSSPSSLPPVPTLSTPAHLATNIPVYPAFAWSVSSGASSYQLQVSTTQAFATTAINDSNITTNSWVTGPLNVNTKYHWRVRASGPTGTSAYSASDSFTVATALESAPVLTAPANSATGVPVSAILQWAAFPAAEKYHVQFGSDSTFNTLLINDSLTTDRDHILPATIPMNTTYYWRVRAKGPAGTSAWSTRWSFTTVPNPPAAPTLSSPANASSSFPVPPASAGSLTWNSVGTAVSYRLQVSTDTGFVTLVYNDTTTGITLPVSAGITANTQYYWRVQAKNAGGTGAFSLVRTFNTSTAVPGKVTLTAPTYGNNDVNVVSPAFTWQAPANAVTYHIQVSVDSNFASSFYLNDSTVSGLNKVGTTQLANVTTYYWRVRAKNPIGYGTYSDKWKFVSNTAPTQVPAAPELVSPGAFVDLVSPSSVPFSWKTSSTATSYRIQVSTTHLFTTIAFQDSTVTGLSKTFTSLAGSTEYFWRVSAINGVGEGSFQTEIRSFTTAAIIPVAPTLVSPDAFAINLQPLSIKLIWKKVPGAVSYRVQISTASAVTGGVGTGFTSTIVSDTTIDTTRTVGPFNDNQPYFWHVLAKNSAGSSLYSTTRQFNTGVLPVPDAPALVFPGPFSDTLPLSLTLLWSSAAGATSYKVQVGVNSAFDPPSTILVSDSGTFTSRAITGLTAGKEYFWRVYGKNSAGVSTPSVRRFTTRDGTPILPAHIALQNGTLATSEFLRFGLPSKERVVIRMFNTRGRKIAPDYDKTLEGGYHNVRLPEELRGSFYLIEFQAGAYRQTVKVHP